MSQLSYTPLTDGDQPLSAGFNSRYLLAINLLNSGIESDNLASSAVTTAKIANDSITTSKLAHPVLFEKSSDIASATTTDLSTATGNAIDITGTTTITAFGTVQSGAILNLRFTGILILTHHATSLILPTGANITTQAGDTAAFESLGSGNWVCIGYLRKDGTSVGAASTGNSVQVVNTQSGAVATGTTAIPADDTIPQSSEGDQYMTLAITPNSASNYLEITYIGQFNHTNNTGCFAMALFQDSTANALDVATTTPGVFSVGGGCITISKTFRMTAGTTSATTFKVRAGNSSAGTTTFNGTAGARLYGGVLSSSITIREIKV